MAGEPTTGALHRYRPHAQAALLTPPPAHPLRAIRSARRLDSSDRSDLIGCAQGRVKGEVAALAVDDDDAGADLLYQFVVCALRSHVIRGPTGHALLHELVKRADRKLRVRP